MYRLFCYGHRYKKGWFASKNFHSIGDAIKFLTYVKKNRPIYDEYYFYKLLDCDNNCYTLFKIVVGDFSNAVYAYNPDAIKSEVIL